MARPILSKKEMDELDFWCDGNVVLITFVVIFLFGFMFIIKLTDARTEISHESNNPQPPIPCCIDKHSCDKTFKLGGLKIGYHCTGDNDQKRS